MLVISTQTTQQADNYQQVSRPLGQRLFKNQTFGVDMFKPKLHSNICQYQNVKIVEIQRRTKLQTCLGIFHLWDTVDILGNHHTGVGFLEMVTIYPHQETVFPEEISQNHT